MPSPCLYGLLFSLAPHNLFLALDSICPGAEAVTDLGLSVFLSWHERTTHTVQGVQIYTAA